MRENVLRKYVTGNYAVGDEYSGIFQQAQQAKEDIEFFNMYIRRHRVSPFSFRLELYKGMSTKLLPKLYNEYYQYSLDELFIMVTEYQVANKMFDCLNEQGTIFSDDDIVFICKYFEDRYDVKLTDYVSDFIGCSHSCGLIRKKLEEILNK